MSNANRWLPSTTPAIIAGAIGSAVTYGLHALGVLHVPADVIAAITPAVGFITASVVQPPTSGDPTTLGGLVAREIEAQLDREPENIQAIVKAAIGVVNEPHAKVEPTVAAAIAKAVTDGQPLVVQPEAVPPVQ